jgi:hypothetical protein
MAVGKTAIQEYPLLPWVARRRDSDKSGIPLKWNPTETPAGETK